MQLHKVELLKQIGPTNDGAHLFLQADEKIFSIFVGAPEAAAVIREFQNQKFVRPLTHDLIHYIMMGFGISLKHVVISDLRDDTYYATLIFEQAALAGSSTSERDEVRIDARPSDSVILALKADADIYTTDEVLESITDIKPMMEKLPLLDFSKDVSFPFPEGFEAQEDDDDLELPDFDSDEGLSGPDIGN